MCRIDRGTWHMIDEVDLVGMVSDHADLERLCDRLENIADALPHRPTEGAALRLSSELGYLPLGYEDRACALFDRLLGGRPCLPAQTATLGYIRRRIGALAVQAQDLAAAFEADAAVLPPGLLGYMLRCFFQGCRADMAFEHLAILQFAGSRLTPNARTLLELSLEARCES